MSPVEPQYWPAVQGVHSDTEVRLTLLLYVPFGHKYWLPNLVPAKQYDPTGHACGIEVFDKQYAPDGQVVQLTDPITFPYEPL